jgi:hypothetical protein
MATCGILTVRGDEPSAALLGLRRIETFRAYISKLLEPLNLGGDSLIWFREFELIELYYTCQVHTDHLLNASYELTYFC